MYKHRLPSQILEKIHCDCSFRNFLLSRRRLNEFRLADADALNKKKNHIILVFKEKLTANELTPEILTYKTMGLCIEHLQSPEEIAARIRQVSLLVTFIPS